MIVCLHFHFSKWSQVTGVRSGCTTTPLCKLLMSVLFDRGATGDLRLLAGSLIRIKTPL